VTLLLSTLRAMLIRLLLVALRLIVRLLSALHVLSRLGLRVARLSRALLL